MRSRAQAGVVFAAALVAVALVTGAAEAQRIAPLPKPWSVEPMPSGPGIDANGIVLAQVYGLPDCAIAVSDTS